VKGKQWGSGTPPTTPSSLKALTVRMNPALPTPPPTQAPVLPPDTMVGVEYENGLKHHAEYCGARESLKDPVILRVGY
jgi:hypothetical protein